MGMLLLGKHGTRREREVMDVQCLSLGNLRVKCDQSGHILLPQWPGSAVILIFHFDFVLWGFS